MYYRRSPFLVSYWKEDRLLFENYLTGKVVSASAETADLLDFFDHWRSMPAVCRRWPQYTAKSLRASLRRLTRETLLETASQKNFKGMKRARSLRQWRAWNPAAGFFHMSTKDAYSPEITKEEIEYIEGLIKGRVAA